MIHELSVETITTQQGTNSFVFHIFNPRLPEVFRVTLLPEVGVHIISQSKMLVIWLITLHQVLAKLIFYMFFMFSRSRNPFLTFFTELAMFAWSYHVWGLRKSRPTSGFTGAQGYWWLGLMGFRNFFIPYVFKVRKIHCWHFYRATMFKWPRKSRSTSGLTGTRK